MAENKPYELTVNDRGQLDIIDHIESKKRDAICIYNDLGVPPFSSAKSLCDLLNSKEELIQELLQDNDHKFWKLQYMIQHNTSQLIMHEIFLAMKEGYELSDAMKKHLKELEKETEENLEKALKQEEWVDNLIQYGDSWKKIEDNVTEFYAIMMACSDYPIALRNYSSIDEIIQADDFEDTIKYYRELAKQRINFNSLSESDGDE